MLTIEHLSMTYEDGTVGLEDVSFSLAQGETCALIGANGAGKTSLMMALVGIADFRGRIVAGGVESEKKNLPLLRQWVGLVFQNPDDQLFMPTIFQDVAFGLQNMGLPEDEVKRRTEETLERLEILHLKDRSSLRLSGGEKRMAALATVLAMEPEVILLDEPTAFLDPQARRRLIGVLKGLRQTVLIATHDLPFALEVCKRSIVLTKGKVFADGLSEALLFDEEMMDQGGVEAIRRFG